MTMKKAFICNAILCLLLLCICSCVNNKLTRIYSDNRYKPISKVQTMSYKSPQEREGQDSKNTLGISISGGGSRAQYFGLGVLIGLDEIKKGETTFLNQIDYFSTISGGGFAAGYYLTLTKNEVLKDKSFLEFWKSVDRKDTLQEHLYKAAKPISVLKLWGYERNMIFKSYPRMIDEELLQLGKKYNNKEIKRLFLRDFFISEVSSEKVSLPMFVTNGTIYNNGEQLPFMPHIIDSLKINGSLLPKASFEIDHGYGLPLSYAISGSAAFPGILPMLKLSVADNDKKVIRVIDGGAVDNLGYKTLFKLLNTDKAANAKKRALIVNCAGFGIDEQEVVNERIGIPKLINKSLLYSVEINLLNSETQIPQDAKDYNIVYEKIGFYTLKDRFVHLEETADDNTKDALRKLKESIRNKKTNWTELYNKFASGKAFNGYNNNNISGISKENFKEFKVEDVFALYELSAQVETKIKIYDWEKEILILAGRYAVYLNESKIQELLD